MSGFCRKLIWTILLAPVALVLLLALALYCPPVQNWAVQKAAVIASEETGMVISVGSVRLAFPLDLKLCRVHADSLANIEDVIVDVQLLPLFGGEVMVDELTLNGAQLDTDTLIKAVCIKGAVRQLTVAAHGVNLKRETIQIDKAHIDGADLDIILADSVPEDTSKSEVFWKIHSDVLQISDTKVRLSGKGLDIAAGIEDLTADGGDFNLHDNEYKLAKSILTNGAVRYATLPSPTSTISAKSKAATPLLYIEEANAEVDSFYFRAPELAVRIAGLSLTERRGIKLRELRGAVAMDSTAISVSGLLLRTAHSNLNAQCRYQLSGTQGTTIDFAGQIGKGDLLTLSEFIPLNILNKLPNKPIVFGGKGKGTANGYSISNLYAAIPNTLSLNIKGLVNNPTDMNRLWADLRADFDCKNTDVLTQFVDPALLAGTGVSLPKGLPLKISTSLKGGTANLQVEDFSVQVPSVWGRGKPLLSIAMQGKVLNLSSLTGSGGSVKADGVSVNFEIPNLDFIKNCVSPSLLAGAGVTIPQGIGLKGTAGIKGDNYLLDLTATEGGGQLRLAVEFNPLLRKYSANAEARQLALNHFMPSLGIGALNASLSADGSGYDPFQPSTQIQAEARIASLTPLGEGSEGPMKTDVNLSASISAAKLLAQLTSDNNILRGDIDIEAPLLSAKGKGLKASICGHLFSINFYRLGVSKAPLTLGLETDFDLAYNFKDDILLKGKFANLSLTDTVRTYHPADINLDILTTSDTTHAVINCGDLALSLNAKGGYKSLIDKANAASEIVVTDLKRQTIDINRLWGAMPWLSFSMKAGQDNPASRLLKYNGLSFSTADISLNTNPIKGVNSDILIHGANYDSIPIDTISLKLRSSEKHCIFLGKVANNKKNPQMVFTTLFAGRLLEHGVKAKLTIRDKNNDVGLRFGLDAGMEEGGIRVTVQEDENTVLGYQKFNVNKGNYIFLQKGNRISADMSLRSADGKGIGLYSNDENTDAVQDLTLSLNKINLKEILSAVPFAPDVRGILDSDFHYVQEENKSTISTSTSIQKLNYSGHDIGDFSTDLSYMPENDGTHRMDGVFSINDIERCSLRGSYNMKSKAIDAKMTLSELPLNIANGFIPNRIVGLKGHGEGELAVTGTAMKPIVNGELFLKDCQIFSEPYGINLHFSNDPVRFKDSRLLFENFEMFAYNDSPLVTSGYLDFSDLDKMFMDVKMRTENFNIINAKENERSEAYGKAYVNFFGSMKGALSNLSLRGRLDVLDNTNLAYILRDSPITTENRMKDLVKFVNFKDTTKVARVEKPKLSGFTMDMTLSIARGSTIMAYLNTNHTNYVDLTGNGSLRMTCSPTSELRLTGKYNLLGGKMKYSLPVIPLKTFDIRENSYVEFTGDILNPRLNIAATEDKKANVDNGTGGYRAVEFKCGVVITRTLKDMGLEFTLEAPTDLQMATELAAMSKEMRGKLAVTMLTTGMYLADGNTSAFSMNSALSQFLQSEINNITGSALRTIDLSFGFDNNTDQTGQMRTDYSFKFAKRFLNNRLKVSVGGKVSTQGSIEREQFDSFHGNLELEYRIDKEGSKFLNLFYDNNSYDWLDGNTQKFGGGFLWRRSVMNFLDLFRTQAKIDSLQRAAAQKSPTPTVKNTSAP